MLDGSGDGDIALTVRIQRLAFTAVSLAIAGCSEPGQNSERAFYPITASGHQQAVYLN